MHASGTGVCVMIAAFNSRAVIARSVQSALAQEHVQEVVVCDDASRDDTAAIARAQDDGTGRLSVITLSQNKGPAAARNAAIAASRSPYVCVLDADDYFLPGRIDRLFKAEPGDWDMLADDIIIVPQDLEPVSFSFPASERKQHVFTVDVATFVLANISRRGRPRAEWGFLKPLISRAFLRGHKFSYDETLRLGEDYALYVRALMAGARFRVTRACGYVAIEQSSSLSSQHSARDLKNIADFDAHCLAGGTHLTSKERAALAAHHSATLHKYDYRTVLDIKRDHGRIGAIGALLRRPRSLPYIAAETIRAKTAGLTAHLGRTSATRNRHEVRCLIGDPWSATIRYTAPGSTERTISTIAGA